MIRLNKAPLQEVSAQLKWHIHSSEFPNYGFLAGDYFNEVEEYFNQREGIAPNGIPFELILNNPTHKFKRNDFDYPFVLIGPGVISITIDNENYIWDKFKQEISKTIEPIFKLIPKLSDLDHIHLSLEYINFFEIDFELVDPFTFLDKKMHTTVKQEFVSQQNNGFDLNFSYKDDNLGILKFAYNKGQVKDKGKGLIVRTTVLSGIHPSNLNQSNAWFELAHKKCSDLFKEMTKGELYDSFK